VSGEPELSLRNLLTPPHSFWIGKRLIGTLWHPVLVLFHQTLLMSYYFSTPFGWEKEGEEGYFVHQFFRHPEQGPGLWCHWANIGWMAMLMILGRKNQSTDTTNINLKLAYLLLPQDITVLFWRSFREDTLYLTEFDWTSNWLTIHGSSTSFLKHYLLYSCKRPRGYRKLLKSHA